VTSGAVTDPRMRRARQCAAQPEVISAQARRAVFPDATSERDTYRERVEREREREKGKAAFVGEAGAIFDSRLRAAAAAAVAVKVGLQTPTAIS